MTGPIESINDGLAAMPKEQSDRILDKVSESLQKAGHPLCSIKAMRRIKKQGGRYDGVVLCLACNKHWTVEEWPEGEPCPGCKKEEG